MTVKTDDVKRVERTWIGTGGYGRFRGEWVKEHLKISTDVSPVMILESPRGVTAIYGLYGYVPL